MSKPSKPAGKFGESPSLSIPSEVFDVRVPKYLRHKKIYARVILGGREIHLGLYGSPESKASYERVVSEWLQSGRKTPAPKRHSTIEQPGEVKGISVTELCVLYFKYAQKYYMKNGKPTSEVEGIQLAIRELRKLYGDILVDSFGPTSLKTFRGAMINRNLARTTINKQCRRVLRMFRWAVSENIVRPETLTALQSVPGLKAGRSPAREPERVKPVSEEELEAIKPYLNPVIDAMVMVQKLTGMRPGEVVGLRTCDIDFSDRIWTFRPPSHKMQHHQKDRVIFFGPLAQEVLTPWLKKSDPTAYLFSPAEAEKIRHAQMRASRKSKVQPSQQDRSLSNPRKKPGDSYTVISYRRAISYACKKAGVKAWHPNQLRHLAATNLRRELGIEVAKAVLGHTSIDVTEIYAEKDATIARDAMARLG
jgi:integrase